ncbi:glycosyltransferase family 2 protein [Flavobacterium sp. ZB4R12]|uniref:glycosyltransferase family 2 protein n=1 Tax=Flavobacterium sp. ZB4R12 TaxID=3398732 RepID=UPI003AAD2921
MIENKIILTIGIPVYNGEAFIEDTIKSIHVPKEIEDRVEIIVSDNCSTDKTTEIVKGFSFVKYLKNIENVGYDRNLQNIFLKASGKYVWTIAADDIITSESAINKIINLIETNPKVALIHVGGNQELNNEYNFYNGENFLIDSKFQSGGVSSNIIKRETWLNSNPSSFFDSGWIHFGVIMNIVNSFESIVIKNKLIDENPRSASLNKSWDSKGSSLVVMLNLIKLFRNMNQLNYSKKVQKEAKLIIKSSYPKEIIKAKAKGLKVNLNLIFDFISCYRSFPSFWIIDFPALVSPRWLCQYIYEQRNTLKRK